MSTDLSILLEPSNKGVMRMKEKQYQTPELEKVEMPEEDIVSTSPTIELPWLPVED